MVTKNKALWIAATDVVEIVERLGAALTPELREEHAFPIEIARAIEKGALSGNGSIGTVRALGATYTALSVAYWEHCEELRKANDAFKARQAAEKKPESLDEVLADRPPRYRAGDVLLVRQESWDGNGLRAVVQQAVWREEDLKTWVYTVQTDSGIYAIREDDPSWDVDFK